MKVKYQQLYSNECGKCAIQNLLDQWHIHFNKIEVKYDEKGTSIYHMVNELKKYFYRVEAVIIDINEIKKVKKFTPYIALIQHQNISHYVVIYKKNQRFLYVLDSLTKRSYKLTYKQFEKLDSKQAIIVESKKQIHLKLFQYKEWLFMPILSLIESLLLLSTTVLIQQIIDNGFKDALLYLCVQVFLLFITSYKTKRFLKLFKKIDHDIVFNTMTNIYHLDEQYVKKYSIDEIYYRIQDAYQYKSMILTLFYNIINDVLLSICALTLIFVYSYILAILLIIISFFIILISLKIFKKTKVLVEEKRTEEYHFLNTYRDSFKNASEIFIQKNTKYFQESKDKLLAFQKKDFECEKLNMKKNLILLYYQTFVISFMVVVYFTKLYEMVSIGSLVALINLSTLMLQPILNICSEIVRFSNFSLVKKRISDLNENIRQD